MAPSMNPDVPLIAASRMALPSSVEHEKFVTVGPHNARTNNHLFARFMYPISRNRKTRSTARAGSRSSLARLELHRVLHIEQIGVLARTGLDDEVAVPEVRVAEQQ